MIYYIADMHFGHTNVLRFDNRPFSDTAQMDDTLIQNWNERVADDDTIYILGDAFWKNEENSIQIMERLRGHKHLIQGNHDRVKGKLRFYWESITQYAEVNDENRLVILSHYPMLFYKNQHHGATMLYGHVHNTSEWELVEKWKKEQWAMGIPSRLINVGCMMEYMRYTPRTLTELLDANIEPAEYDISSGKEYKELLQLISRNEDKLLATMTEEQKELFTKYADCVREYQVMAECLLFQNSFRLGGRMMLEVMRSATGNE